MRKLIYAVMAVSTLASAAASEPPAARSTGEAACTWESVARKWKVNPYMLYAIAKTESNLNPRAINRANTNGSEDVGMMQINSFWFPKLAKLGIKREHLFDPCVSLDVAGWILSQNMDRHGNTWTAVGAYNAASPDKRIAYAKKVLRNLPRQAFENGHAAQ
ncbi:MAG: hypothetical protein AzoDbin1_03990 [Azoarcus sp.]|nr:hypothetical protein [Azoarcus sp.]